MQKIIDAIEARRLQAEKDKVRASRCLQPHGGIGLETPEDEQNARWRAQIAEARLRAYTLALEVIHEQTADGAEVVISNNAAGYQYQRKGSEIWTTPMGSLQTYFQKFTKEWFGVIVPHGEKKTLRIYAEVVEDGEDD